MKDITLNTISTARKPQPKEVVTLAKVYQHPTDPAIFFWLYAQVSETAVSSFMWPTAIEATKHFAAALATHGVKP